MRYIIFFLFLLMQGVVQAQFGMPSNQDDTVRDTTYYQYFVQDSAFFEVREIEYRNGYVARLPLVRIGDTVQVVARIVSQNTQLAEQAAQAQIAAVRTNQAVRQIRNGEATLVRVTGANAQQYIAQSLGLQLNGAYEMKRGTETRNATIDMSNQQRLRLTVLNETPAYVIEVFGPSWIRLTRGTGSNRVTIDLLQFRPGFYRNVENTFSLERRRARGNR